MKKLSFFHTCSQASLNTLRIRQISPNPLNLPNRSNLPSPLNPSSPLSLPHLPNPCSHPRNRRFNEFSHKINSAILKSIKLNLLKIFGELKLATGFTLAAFL